MPILSSVLISVNYGTVAVTGTDLTIGIVSAYEDNGLIGQAFQAVVPAKQFHELIKRYTDDDLYLTLNGLTLELKCGKSSCELSTYNPDEYPPIQDFEGVVTTVYGKDAQDLFGQVVYAVSEEQSRPFLCGVYVEGKDGKLCACATDSWRLGYNETDSNAEFGGVIIPSGAVKATLGILTPTMTDLTVKIGENRASFAFGSTTITTSVIEGSFPNFRQLLPKGQGNFAKMNRKDTINATDRVKLMGETKVAKLAHLEFTDAVCKLSSKRNERGQSFEEVDIATDCKLDPVTVDVDYLNEVFRAIPEDEVIISVTGTTKPMYLQGDGDTNARHLLMPVKL